MNHPQAGQASQKNLEDAAILTGRADKQACREQNWHECGLEAKVERLRDAMLRIEHALNYSGATATEALKVAKLHEHGAKGNVLVPTVPEYVGEANGPCFGPYAFNRLR